MKDPALYDSVLLEDIQSLLKQAYNLTVSLGQHAEAHCSFEQIASLQTLLIASNESLRLAFEAMLQQQGQPQDSRGASSSPGLTLPAANEPLQTHQQWH